MKLIKISLSTSLIGMLLLGTISKVYGDTKEQVKTDVGITFIDGPTPPVEPSNNHLMPLGAHSIPFLICAGLALLALGGLLVYLRKKGILKHEKK
ncbi:hypothetical protein [Pseudolactococcus paracarnosus]|uniref:Uncharacterized protein n=1 Tax=Pseudolactococcus paracarnosus TaxID=2749962 RepID=A0A7L4WAY4_9LACT|nr:hypothetical protein [Lactococcus paracarnosus]SPC38094.1 exported hypothetical protein [Lactococcus piscium]MCJ1978229.1 hypothetical protein [Lactococcus paracarnosus]MCJ1984372.1 hypothetical protein [Lactococcus paracarnosus]MCJ1994404.1 hypothetical protein [Lactococcus paracarnosus]MCJ1999022.1 hypothetical protein [Lactococcus paracarnosus]